MFEPNICSGSESLFKSVEAEDNEDDQIADALGVVLVHAQVHFPGKRDLVFNKLTATLVLRNFFLIFRFLVDLKIKVILNIFLLSRNSKFC